MMAIGSIQLLLAIGCIVESICLSEHARRYSDAKQIQAELLTKAYYTLLAGTAFALFAVSMLIVNWKQ